MHVPFIFILLEPSVAKELGIMFFQRNLLFAHRQVDPEIARVALTYFYDHVLHWLTCINFGPRIFAQVPPHTIGAVKAGSFPDCVYARGLLKYQSTGLRSLFYNN